MQMRIAFFILLQVPLLLWAQDYNVASIPDSLKLNANAVKRFEEKRLVIKGPGKAVLYKRYVVTVFNESGDIHAIYRNSYDKLHTLSDISGTLYDALGKKLKTVRKKDIADASLDDDISLVTDNRYKMHSFYYRQYPYTVEYQDEVTMDGVFFLPGWRPVDDDELSVQHSTFVVETVPGYVLRHKQFNYPGGPVVTDDGKVKTYKWEVNNILALQSEPLQPDWEELTCSVQVAPVDFEVGGYTGNMSSWQNLGKFIATLNEGRDVLPDAIKKEVHALTDNVTDQREKVRLLYEYLQKNTRYISIQVGIGSWQPFDAAYVAQKKYGDCKALSNYMKSLLKEAGVVSNYVLINSGYGERGLWEDFPAPYFSHAILCVPNNKDSIWLECTSNTVSAGYMGSFTGDRQALLIDNDGGHVVWTPRYTAADNSQHRKIVARLDGEGNLVADVRTIFTGIRQEEPHDLIHRVNKEQRERYLNNALGLPTYKVDKIDYAENKGAAGLPLITESLHVESAAYASVSGKRLFITPNLFNKTRSKFSTDKPRKFEIKYSYSDIEVDSIDIAIPEGYTAEALPKNVSIETRFGKYAIAFVYTGNRIQVVRSCERTAGRYPASDYKALAKFYADMYKADRSAMVFVKN